MDGNQWRSYSRAFGANAPAKNYKIALFNTIFFSFALEIEKN
jgi:hypothetical protein